jgi:hypothetical protein
MGFERIAITPSFKDGTFYSFVALRARIKAIKRLNNQQFVWIRDEDIPVFIRNRKDTGFL